MGRLKKDHSGYSTLGKWKKYQYPTVDDTVVKTRKNKKTKVKLKTLVKKFKDAEAVADRVIELYPDQKNSRQGYVEVAQQLLKLKTTYTRMKIEVCEVEDWFDKSKYVHVSGVMPHEEMRYAIEFTRWEQWLYMEITRQSLKDFSELDIYCHCLWEMTWSGFSQEPIQEKLQGLLDTVAEIHKDDC